MLAIVLVSIVLGGPLLASTALPVQSAAANSSYAVAQGTTCSVVSPIDGVDQNVSSFYDYRNPYTTPSASTYSSYGTTELQESRGSVLVFYEGPEGTSMVLIHDRLGDEAGGSTATFQFSGLPGGEWAVEDDDYPNRDDDWDTDGSDATIDWKWGDNRTDGGAYRGLDEMDTTIVIDARFNEEADHWGDWSYSGSDEHRVTSWTLVNGDETQARSLALDRRVFVHRGGCEVTPPSVAIDGPESTEAGTNVTFDASGTTDDGAIGGYEWDFDGDGTVDEITVDATITHAFDSAGTYEVSVTAFDTYGNGDTASTTVDVEQPETPPDASLTAPGVATVDEPVTLNASGSTDEGSITSYEWDVDGDGTFEERTTTATLDYTYTQTGEYTATVRVTDDANQTSTDSTTVSVREPNQPPSADLSAPDTTIQGQGITLDASGSSDDREIAEYHWDFDGDGTIDLETENETVGHSYQETGTVTPTVTVVDSDGATDNASRTVEVNEPETPPTAALSAPESVAVDNSVTLDASGSSDEGTIVEYRWDFEGDGTVDATTAEPTVDHTYTSVGKVEPNVTVVDNANQTHTASTVVNVTELALQPEIEVSSTSATVGDTISFDASASQPADRITDYEWTFEDGTTATGATTTHSYESAGEYTVRLRVTTDAGQTATATATVSVAARSGGGGGGGGNGGGGNGGGGNGGGGGGGAGSGGGGGGGGDSTPPTDDSSQSEPTTPPEPNVSNVTVSTDSRTLVEGETFVVDASVTNHGNATGTKTIEFAVEGTVVTERTFSIDPNETRTVTFTHRFTSPGTKTIRIDHGEPFEVRVESASPDVEVTALRADPATVDVGQDITFSATVTNTGHAEGSRTVELQLFGETVDIQTVTLEPGAEATVTFTRSIDAPGTYEAVVANESVEIQVTGRNAMSTTGDGGESRAMTPGFGLFAALTAVILAALVLSRRDRRN